MRDGRPNPDIWGNIITCGEIAVGIYEIVGTKKRGLEVPKALAEEILPESVMEQAAQDGENLCFTDPVSNAIVADALLEQELVTDPQAAARLDAIRQLDDTLSLWLSAPVSWDNVSLPGLRVLHLRGEKNGDITPLLTSITYLHLEEMRKTEDLAAFLTPATRLQKLYLQSLPAVQELPALDGLPSLYALKLYELHKLNDLSALSHSHLRYFAASLIGDKLSAQELADAVMAIPNLEAAALQLADRSERRYGGVQKAFAAAGKSALLWEEISVLTTWLSL